MLKTAAGTILATITTGILMQIWVYASEISNNKIKIFKNEENIKSMHDDIRDIRRDTQDILKMLIKKK